MKYEFSKPFTFEGKEYKEIELDYDGLDGSDVEAVLTQIEIAVRRNPKGFPVSSTWKFYAARAGKLPVEFFTKLPAKEYLKLSRMTNSFLEG